MRTAAMFIDEQRKMLGHHQSAKDMPPWDVTEGEFEKVILPLVRMSDEQGVWRFLGREVRIAWLPHAAA